MDSPDNHVTKVLRLCYGLSEDPQNYCNPEGRISGGTSGKEAQDGARGHSSATRASMLPSRSERRIRTPAVAVPERLEPESEEE